MRALGFSSVLALSALSPMSADAAVVINEIAWMGSSASASDEWIELANSESSPISLSGWKLTSSTGSPTITLHGSIAAGGYYLLERTSDGSVPSIAADELYAGALANSGATLTLADANGATVDTVVGGTDWKNIGGNNARKETAQRFENGWKTAPATPRANNVPASDLAPKASPSASADTPVKTSSGSSTYVPPPSSLLLEVTATAPAVAEAPTHFSARVFVKKGGATDPNATVHWSFGDGSALEGREVEKVYRYPGTYLVQAQASDGDARATEELTVVVRPLKMHIASVSAEGITIINENDVRADLSGWRLVSGTGFFRIPEGTILLPGVQILFPSAITNLPTASDATLAYPSGILATRYAPPEPIAPALAVAATSPTPERDSAQPLKPETGSSSVQTVEPALTSESAPAHDTQAVSAPADATTLAAAGASLPAPESSGKTDAGKPASSGSSARSPWFFGLIGVAAIAAVALVIL